jgi:acyl-coenzyme A thioesterase PaaI-like protein
MFVNDLGFAFDMSEDGMSMTGEATITDALRSTGTSLPRPSVLATIADCVAGIPAFVATSPRLAVTLDIAVRIVSNRCGDRLALAGEVVKMGRSTVAAEVRFSDPASQELVAHSYVTFMVSPRPQDVAPPVTRGMRTTGSMPIAFPDHIGMRIIEPGVTEIEHGPFLQQASGTLQGGAVALLGELAAESLTQGPVLDLDTRYLSAVRQGPGRATAHSLGAGQVRAEVRDVGMGNRLAALVTARVGTAR